MTKYVACSLPLLSADEPCRQRTKKSTKISAAAPAQAPVPLKRSARIAAAQKSSRSQATRAPLVPVPSASNGNSTTAPAPTAPSTIAPKRMLTEAERKVILQASPAVYEFTKAGVRCAVPAQEALEESQKPREQDVRDAGSPGWYPEHPGPGVRCAERGRQGAAAP